MGVGGARVARSKAGLRNGVWTRLETNGANASGRAGARAAEDIAAQIRELIVANELSEGERLPSERDLAPLFSTSRPTVSQAIRILVIQGLVESRHGSGAYVTRRPGVSLAASVDLMLSLNRQSVAHLADLRLWLETMGVLGAIQNASPKVIEEAQEALDELTQNAGDTAAWMSSDTRFHATLVRASANPYLASIYESVHSTLIDYEYRTWVDKGTVPAWLRESEAAALAAVHEPILRAVRERDPDAARGAVLHHHEEMSRHLAASEIGDR